MRDLKSIFSFNGVNYHDLQDSDKVIFDKLVGLLKDDFKNIQLTIENYFDVSTGDSGDFTHVSFIPEPLDTKIWITFVELKSNNIL